MKNIPLTQGQFAIVDDEDYEELSRYKWQAKCSKSNSPYYAVRSRSSAEISGTAGPDGVRMHRVIMNAPRCMLVDHINHNTLDNRKENLRLCTSSQNLMNRGKTIKNTSGLKGVFWHKGANKWMAQIRANKKTTYLGLFSNKSDASKAYNEAAKEYFGEFKFQDDIKLIKENKA